MKKNKNKRKTELGLKPMIKERKKNTRNKKDREWKGLEKQ